MSNEDIKPIIVRAFTNDRNDRTWYLRYLADVEPEP